MQKEPIWVINLFRVFVQKFAWWSSKLLWIYKIWLVIFSLVMIIISWTSTNPLGISQFVLIMEWIAVMKWILLIIWWSLILRSDKRATYIYLALGIFTIWVSYPFFQNHISTIVIYFIISFILFISINLKPKKKIVVHKDD